MYSDNKQVLELVALIRAYGVKHIVLCPGSRNAPLAHTFAACDSFQCHAVTDERSAGFVALGLMEGDEKGVVVCCTSGSALLNLAPSVAEAYHRQRPLIVVSADRPAAWIGQMDGQTIAQEGVFARFTQQSVNLPEVTDKTSHWHCNKLINDALNGLTLLGGGPVHINVPISEPLYRFTEAALPACRRIEPVKGRPISPVNPSHAILETYSALAKRLKTEQRVLVIIGQLHELEHKTIAQLAPKGWHFTTLCESLSNYRANNCIRLFDRIIGIHHNEELIHPDLVIVLGGHIVSKNLKRMLRTSPPQELWQVGKQAVCPDTYQCATHFLQADIAEIAALLTQCAPQEKTAYQERWEAFEQQFTQQLANYAYTDFADLALLNQLVNSLANQPSPATPLHIHLANSSMVRNFQLTPYRKEWVISCNRGVNGIEGSLSLAVGDALAHPDATIYCLIGDLSFFYDMNVLGITQLPQNLRIGLINNNGGQIFTQLNGLSPTAIRDQYIASRHSSHHSARGWCRDNGITYMSAENREEFATHLPTFTSHTHPQVCMLFEMLTHSEINEKEQIELATYLKK